MTDTLVLLHVIFRHGDRTPDKEGIYPKDPHKDHDYAPYGYGQLTNAGKRKAYRLGQSLRERYSHFLDDFYKPEHLDALTSDVDRTKMTLKLVLASLYPPKNEQVWLEGLPWQPIPYNCTPAAYDKIFLGLLTDQRSITEYKNYVNGAGRDIMKPYEDSMLYIEHHTGIKIESPRYLLHLAATLSIQENMGLKLPDWTKEVWPHRIEELAMKEFEFAVATPQIKSLAVEIHYFSAEGEESTIRSMGDNLLLPVQGRLFQKIVCDSMLKIKDSSQRKLHLYSGHDHTIAAFLKTLNLLDQRLPDSCANLAIELHKIDGIYGFMIKYQRSESESVKLLQIPNVGSFWPIEDFIEYNRFILEDRPHESIK